MRLPILAEPLNRHVKILLRSQATTPKWRVKLEVMKRIASAVWTGSISQGAGTLTTHSGVLTNSPYSFQTRFGDQPGTNPEELLAAAHAGCFSMALSLILGEAGMKPEKIETTATVSLIKDASGFTISESHLDVTATIPGADPAAFQKAAQAAEAGCPVSKLFKTKITMEARLAA
jgi:osmotically inducible protein OsmC